MDPFPDVDAWLVELAQLDGVRSATLDPAHMVTPGVWAKVPTFGLDTLEDDQVRVDVELYLAVSDADWKKARRSLMALFGTVREHLGNPRVEARFVTLSLPGNAADVPALTFNTTLRVVPDPPTDD